MFTPLNKRILIKPNEAQDLSKGGLYIPDSAKERPQIGTIVAVALDCEVLNQEAVGSRVMYGKYAGGSIELTAKDSEEKETFLIVPEKELLGII
jgi:chaperonin GroES